ncbi:triadin [Microcaecilia unicolor]|uniref:Triadin-like n=1 Tax=Microcaecilia unicolor TaxID=1415580 RepID=A0A6P7XCM1_9AMPH|nr:triadin-like [Microcaecilia unicolor]
MAEVTAEGPTFTTTTVIDNKNGSVLQPPVKMSKKSVTEDLLSTFSSPTALLLVVALIVTWSAVAIIMFDLVDYKTFAATYSQHCDDPCLPPGIHQSAVGIVPREAENSRGGAVNKLRNDPINAIHEAVEDSTEWFYGFVSVLSDIISPDGDEGGPKSKVKKIGETPTFKAKAFQRGDTEKTTVFEKKSHLKVSHQDKHERKEKPEKKEKHEKIAAAEVRHKDKAERKEKLEKKAPPKEFSGLMWFTIRISHSIKTTIDIVGAETLDIVFEINSSKLEE